MKKYLAQSDCVIGICLGAHFLCNQSEEGGSGVGSLHTDVKQFKCGKTNIGYVEVNYLGGIYRLYHCHNYFIPNSLYTASSRDHFGDVYTTHAIYKNMTLIQGHPEKSGHDGERLVKCILKNHDVFPA